MQIAGLSAYGVGSLGDLTQLFGESRAQARLVCGARSLDLIDALGDAIK